MPKYLIVPRDIKILRGNIPGLKVGGPPGETVREIWIQTQARIKPYKNRRNSIRNFYENVRDYVKEKLGLNEEIDSRDELISGLEKNL